MSKPGLRTKKIVEIKAVPPYRFFHARKFEIFIAKVEHT